MTSPPRAAPNRFPYHGHRTQAQIDKRNEAQERTAAARRFEQTERCYELELLSRRRALTDPESREYERLIAATR